MYPITGIGSDEGTVMGNLIVANTIELSIGVRFLQEH